MTGGLISAMGLKDVLGSQDGIFAGSWVETGSVTDGKMFTRARAGTAGCTLEFPLDDTGQWPLNGQPIIVFAGGHWWGDMGGGTFAIDVYDTRTSNWTEVGQFSAQGLYVFNNPIPWNNPPYLTKVRLRNVIVGSYGWVSELRIFGRTTHGWLTESTSARRGNFETVIADGRVMQRGVYAPVGRFDVPAYLDATIATWTRANQRTCVGFDFSQYNEFVGPGQTMYTRLCAAFSDGSCAGDTISFRIIQDSGNSPVYYTTGFGQACAGGAGLTHHVCGPWVPVSTISCGYSWENCCRIDVMSNATEQVFVGGIQMEIAVK